MMRVIIVGDGPSATGFKPPDGVCVIAVNGVIDWIHRANIWFTLDDSLANIKRMKNRREDVAYCAALSDHSNTPPEVIQYERVAKRGKEPQEKHSPEWWLWRWSAVPGLNIDPGKINTGNSAWGALQLAIKMFNQKKIVLIGVDGTAADRVSGGKPSALDHLPLLFNSVVGEAAIVNGGQLKSRLPKMNKDEAIEWLMR